MIDQEPELSAETRRLLYEEAARRNCDVVRFFSIYQGRPLYEFWHASLLNRKGKFGIPRLYAIMEDGSIYQLTGEETWDARGELNRKEKALEQAGIDKQLVHAQHLQLGAWHHVVNNPGQ